MSNIYPYFLTVDRWIIALLSLALIFLWIKYFKGSKKPLSVLACFSTKDKVNINIFFKENIIGRNKNADIMLPVRGVEKKHAVLYYENDGWVLAPLQGKVAINLLNITEPAPLEYGDKITIAGQTLSFNYKFSEDISSQKPVGAFKSLFCLSLFQFFIFLEIWLKPAEKSSPYLFLSFGALALAEWIYYIIGKAMSAEFKMLAEIPVLYLSSLGLAVLCCHSADALLKHIICYFVGFVLYLIFTVLLRFQRFILKFQRIFMFLSLGILYYTAFFGVKVTGSRNWLNLAGIVFQPSELVKVAFVFSGGAALYTVVSKSARMWEFLIYSLLCMGALAIMLDFGAVAIFFVGMMVILTLRLTNPAILSGIFGAAVFGGIGIVLMYPYIAKRFGVWLHAWEYANSNGYQQTRTMIASASGGLLGVGGGNGYLAEVSAAKTDLVFGIISEEWGGIAALATALCFVALGFYAYRLAKNSKSLFCSITVGAAASMIIFQTALNIFGSLDLLPLTGVTMIFVSKGGTSLVSAWLMISFFKAAELEKTD